MSGYDKATLEQQIRDCANGFAFLAADDVMVLTADRAAVATFEYKDDGETLANAEIALFPNKKRLNIDWLNSYATNHPSFSGRQAVKNILTLADELEYDTLHVTAVEVGGYFWARCGFTPTPEAWEDAKEGIQTRLGGLKIINALHGLEDATQLVEKALESDDPRMIGVIADSKLGITLLDNMSWEGNLDLHDATARQRLETYISAPKRYQSMEEGMER